MAKFDGERPAPDPHAPEPKRGHELSDVNLRPLVWIAGILIAVAVLVHVGLWLAMRTFERDQRQSDPAASPFADARPAPPEPRLQPTLEHHPTLPFQDVTTMNQHNRQVLSSYGWVDRERGIVRIPIEQAMQQLIERSQRAATPTTNTEVQQ